MADARQNQEACVNYYKKFYMPQGQPLQSGSHKNNFLKHNPLGGYFV